MSIDEKTDHPELVEFEGETLGDTLTNMLAEIKRLRKSYDTAVKQLQNTRKWIRKYHKLLREISHQAEHVSCTALDIEEWIKDVKLF